MNEKLKDYEYICFLHDKNAKHYFLKSDIEFWIDGMWSNLLYSKWYVEAAVNYLEKGYGLLLPPKPIGTYIDSYYTDSWADNFRNVCRLAERLKLETDITRNRIDEISLGTAFWCNTRALKKLFDYDWTYEDFVEEPMPDDGTISHAIERILGFVALDAGYKIATIMNTEYAACLIDILGEKLRLTYSWMNDNLGVKNTYQLENYDREKYEINRIFAECEQVFLYGAGYYGEKYLRRLEFWGYHPDGFIVTDGMIKSCMFNDLPVYELSEIDEIKKKGIIVSVNPDLQEEICEMLKSKGYTNFIKATVL